jgi:integrase/recombinase XerD
MEDFSLKIINDLSNYFNLSQLKVIKNTLEKYMVDYDINKKCTDLITYNDEIPSEIKSFLICKNMKGLTKSSLQNYKLVLEHFSYNINKNIKQLTSYDIRVYLLSYEQTHNISKSTLDDKRRVLCSFFKWMLAEEIITKNPMLRIDNIKCDQKVYEPLADIELEQMRSNCITLREKAIFETLYSTGCRVSELIGMDKVSIDFENAKVKVYGKGKKERWCFLNAKSLLMIKKYMFSRNDDNDALFIADKLPYNRLNKGSVEKCIKQIGIRAGIHKKVTPHTIRRTTATNMLAHGATITEVQALLGHKKSETTLRYAKLDITSLQNTHKKCVI